jgi:hypothetical protein
MMQVDECSIGAVEWHWRTYSESEQQTSDSFQTCLMRLRETMRDGLSHLLLNSQSAHEIAAVRETDASLGIILYSIAPGVIDHIQSFARAAFGVLNAQAKYLFHGRCGLNRYERRVKSNAVADLLAIWR